MVGRIRIAKMKWDGSVSEDRAADLVHCGAGRLVWTSDDASSPPRTTAARTGHWWIATFGGADAKDVAIDVCTPVRMRGGGFSFVDLDLDLKGRLPGPFTLKDVDDFEERTVSMGYPAWLRAGAWSGLADVRRHLAGLWWPFDGGDAALPERLAGRQR